MKRAGNLYTNICSFSNLLLAAGNACEGKRYRPDVSLFHYYLENELFALQTELETRTYQPGAYHTFHITDPKPRLISAAPYRDRVVHHAICQVIEPLFEKSFIFHSFANRHAKGSHKALDCCTAYCRSYSYALKCDIRKYFPSVDHHLLKLLLARKIKCPDTLWLINTIVDHSNPQEEVLHYFAGDDLFTPLQRPHGIPIGNLTSQYFANIYLSGFDHFVKETLGCKAYLRYVDDFLLFANDKSYLNSLKPRLQAYLDTLRLKLHPTKCQVYKVDHGIPFLGWQVFATHRRLKRATGMRIRKNVKKLALEYQTNQASAADLVCSLASWKGHLKHGNTGGLQARLFAPIEQYLKIK